MIYPATYDIVALQNATFRMRLQASSSGTPININGYVFDADICKGEMGRVASFIPSVVSAASGIVDLELTPAITADLSIDSYTYDVSATSPGGDRYYWLKGSITVSGTCSRN